MLSQFTSPFLKFDLQKQLKIWKAFQTPLNRWPYNNFENNNLHIDPKNTSTSYEEEKEVSEQVREM